MFGNSIGGREVQVKDPAGHALCFWARNGSRMGKGRLRKRQWTTSWRRSTACRSQRPSDAERTHEPGQDEFLNAGRISKWGEVEIENEMSVSVVSSGKVVQVGGITHGPHETSCRGWREVRNNFGKNGRRAVNIARRRGVRRTATRFDCGCFANRNGRYSGLNQSGTEPTMEWN